MRPFCCRGERDDEVGGTPLPTGPALNKLGAFSSEAPPPQGPVILGRIAGPLASSHDLPWRVVFTQSQQEDMTGAEFTHCFAHLCFLSSPVQQRADVVSNPNGSRIISSEEPGGSSHQQILTPPELAHEVVISPGLPTPPLSPFGSVRMSYGGVKVCTEAGFTLHEVEGTEKASAPLSGQNMQYSL